jgi:crotonobetainyl-CoA:carnitine CoA-transferase CaiB-like acyl-CoA transferase
MDSKLTNENSHPGSNGAGRRSGPLQGMKVLDLSIIVAGGTASSLLADFGAEVVKVERPGSGDPLRNWGPFAHGVSLWWKVHSRNKQSLTLDLANPDGQALLLQLAGQADMIIEGFRPGTLERWNIGPRQLHESNPGLVILRYSGFGQTGPYRDRPGFGTIAECMSGYIAMTGFPETPPVLPPIPLADEIAGVFGAMAGMMALYRREVARGSSQAANEGKTGQVIDLSLFEPLFRLCIPHIPMYDLLGIVRERVGNDFPDAAPRSLYQTGDNRWLGLSATSQSTWEALAHAMGLSHYITDPRFTDNASRLENKDALNEILQAWLGSRPLEEILADLVPAGGVVGPVYDSAQIVQDPHYREREDVVEVEDPEIGTTLMPGIIPKFSDTPGAVEHAGPQLGEHNAQVLGSWLGYDAPSVADLADRGVI